MGRFNNHVNSIYSIALIVWGVLSDVNKSIVYMHWIDTSVYYLGENCLLV